MESPPPGVAGRRFVLYGLMVDDPAAEHELRIRIESLSMKLAEIDGRMLYKGLSEAERAKLEREYF